LIGQKIFDKKFFDYQLQNMATKGPPRKRVKKNNIITEEDINNDNIKQEEENLGTVIAQLKSTDGEITGAPLSLPANVTPEQLELLINQLLSNDEQLPYAFSVDDKEITNTLYKDIIQGLKKSTEDVLTIVYQPQAIFRVRVVTRCTSTLNGNFLLCIY
jgi:ribosome assembly protein 4